MRPSGLEPPRGNLPTRPSTLFGPARSVRQRSDRPISGDSLTRRTHLEQRVLPRCCHDDPRAKGKRGRGVETTALVRGDGRAAASRVGREDSGSWRGKASVLRGLASPFLSKTFGGSTGRVDVRVVGL